MKPNNFEALEPKAETVVFPIQHFEPVTRLVEKDEQHRIERGDFDIQLDQGSQAIDGFSEDHGLG